MRKFHQRRKSIKNFFTSLRSWHLLISHLFIPFHFTFSQGGRQQQSERDKLLFDQLFGMPLGRSRRGEETCEERQLPLGLKRNHSKSEAETLEMEFSSKKIVFVEKEKVVVKSREIKCSFLASGERRKK